MNFLDRFLGKSSNIEFNENLLVCSRNRFASCGQMDRRTYLRKQSPFAVLRNRLRRTTTSSALVQALSCRFVTAEARVRQTCSRDRFFSDCCGFSSVSIIPPLLHNYLHPYAALTRWKNARSLGSFQKQCSFRNWGHLIEKYFHIFKENK